MIADFDCISEVQLFFHCYPGRYLSFYGAAIRRIVRASLHFLKYIQLVIPVLGKNAQHANIHSIYQNYVDNIAKKKTVLKYVHYLIIESCTHITYAIP